MQRITKRNKDGSIDLDGLAVALDKLAHYEDTGIEPYEVGDYLLFYCKISNMHNCRDCAKQFTCIHAPSKGEDTRINCFDWEDKDHDYS